MIVGLILLLIIAGIVGALASRLGGTGRVGCLGSIAVGFIGALLGAWLSRLTGVPDPLTLQLRSGTAFPVVWAVAGGALFAAVLTLLTRKRAP